MDLLVSFPTHQYYPARQEVRQALGKLGDDHPRMRWTDVEGVAVVTTDLDPRKVVAGCRQLLCSGDVPFEFALKWVPVDYWCITDLDVIRQLIEQHIAEEIGPGETWALHVKKRHWDRYHTAEIIDCLAPCIDRKVDLESPDKIVWVDAVGAKTAVSLLRPDEIFSALKTQCPPSETSDA